jgi:hypothetical protein
MHKTIALISTLIVAAVSLASFSANSISLDAPSGNNSHPGPQPSPTCNPPSQPSGPIYGVTIESVDNLPEIVDALKQVGAVHRPTTRIVLQQDQQVSDYIEPVRQISGVSDIMGGIADSDSLYNYPTVEDYKNRVSRYLTGLPENVDIWEIGNEVNGEWVGWERDEWKHKSRSEREVKRKLVSAQFIAAFKLAKAKGKTTALTLYYNGDDAKPCWSGDIPDGKEYEMFKWVMNYLKDDEFRACLDYVFISFYEDDCKVLTHDPVRDTVRWVSVFKRLSNLLEAVPAYVGGYFYWYFSQDMVPKPGLRFLKDAGIGRSVP